MSSFDTTVHPDHDDAGHPDHDDAGHPAPNGPLFHETPQRGPRAVISYTSLALARLLRLKPQHGPRIFGQVRRDTLEVPRWALTLAILMLFVLFLAILALFFVPAEGRAASAAGINFDQPTKDWHQGPVRYLITKQEVKAYKALETEAERRNFIDWFWQRRDVVPATPHNEFRDRFEQRVFEATRKFSETTKPGWKTDMGKIYVLVGPPDEINRDVVAKTHRGIVTWIYRRPPFPDLAPNTVVAFAKDTSGEFVVSSSPTLESDVARGLQFSKVKQTADGRYLRPGLTDPVLLDAGVPMQQGKLQTELIAGRLQQLPPAEEELFRAFATTKEYFGGIPAEARLDFYRASDGTTYTTVTVGIRSSAVQYRPRGGREIPDVAVFGKLVGTAEPKVEYPLAADAAFAASAGNDTAGPDDLLIFQATGGFRPGTYDMVLGVQDRVSKKVASFRRAVEIPDLSRKTLTLSSIALAASMEPIDFQPATGKPFHLGKFVVVPQPDNTFKGDGELNVYFQIYDPAQDAATGRARLEIRYTFAVREPDGSLKEIGTYAVPDSPGQVQGYAVPLAAWPKGEYQVTVTVRDLIGDAVASRPALFVIAG
jgi:GWxTD domain-containing protein